MTKPRLTIELDVRTTDFKVDTPATDRRHLQQAFSRWLDFAYETWREIARGDDPHPWPRTYEQSIRKHWVSRSTHAGLEARVYSVGFDPTDQLGGREYMHIPIRQEFGRPGQESFSDTGKYLNVLPAELRKQAQSLPAINVRRGVEGGQFSRENTLLDVRARAQAERAKKTAALARRLGVKAGSRGMKDFLRKVDRLYRVSQGQGRPSQYLTFRTMTRDISSESTGRWSWSRWLNPEGPARAVRELVASQTSTFFTMEGGTGATVTRR